MYGCTVLSSWMKCNKSARDYPKGFTTKQNETKPFIWSAFSSLFRIIHTNFYRFRKISFEICFSMRSMPLNLFYGLPIKTDKIQMWKSKCLIPLVFVLNDWPVVYSVQPNKSEIEKLWFCFFFRIRTNWSMWNCPFRL